jgi:hypothetical protein
MALEFNGTNQYLSSAAPVTSVPITLACWFNFSISGIKPILTLGVSGGSDKFQLYAVSGILGGTGAFVQSGATLGDTGSQNINLSLSTWYHGAAVFSSATSRTAYLNASAGTSVATNVTPSGINTFNAATRYNPTLGNYFNGRIAEVGIWNVALTAAEIASLAKGMTCDKVRPQNLVFYAPLVRNLVDSKGGLTITNNNSATVANHTRVYA